MSDVEIKYKDKYGNEVGNGITTDDHLTLAWNLVNYLDFFRRRNKDSEWAHRPVRLKVVFEEESR